MSKIISIQHNSVKIGNEDGTIKIVRKENLNFYPKIGDVVEVYESENEILVIKAKNIDSNSKKGNTIAIFSLLFTYGTTFFLKNSSSFVSSIFSIFPLIGFVLMIIGRVNYPNNKFLKIVMWIYIISLILVAFGFISLMIACASCASETTSCPG